LVYTFPPNFIIIDLHILRWRPVEAALACCACNAADILEITEEKKETGQTLPFDPSSLLVNVIPSLLENSDIPLLQGRCLVFASKFSTSFSPDVASKYGILSAQVIESQRADLPLKLSAVKAIRKLVF
jgi:importin-9